MSVVFGFVLVLAVRRYAQGPSVLITAPLCSHSVSWGFMGEMNNSSG